MVLWVLMVLTFINAYTINLFFDIYFVAFSFFNVGLRVEGFAEE